MKNREKFILYLIENGKQNSTWSDLALKFGLRDGKQANDFWRYYDRTGNVIPEPTSEPPVSERVPDLPKGAVVQGGWVKENDRSYRFKVEKEVVEENFKEDLINDIKNFSPVVKKIDYKIPEKGVTYEISLPDMHFGKEPINKTVENFKLAVYDLLDKAAGYEFKRFILPIGNDIFHSEGMRRTTTKGTPQFDYEDWRETFRLTWITVAEVILELSTIAPVIVPIVQGNHDFERSFYVGDVLAAYFANNQNVSIDNSLNTRKHILFDNIYLMYDHGEIKADQYPLLMATDRPDYWAASKTRECHNGHLHHQITKEYPGCIVRFMPSLCPNDLWHKMKGYSASRVAQAYVWGENSLYGYFQTGEWLI